VHRPLLGGVVTTPPIAGDIVQVIPRRDRRFPGHPGGSIATGAQLALDLPSATATAPGVTLLTPTGAMMVSDQELDALLKRLHLANTRLAHRQQTRLERVARGARCPCLKAIHDFTLSIDGATFAPRRRAVGRRHDREQWVIFNGKPGLDKTHLAMAIAYGAIQHGFDALWTW
jgi:hypothetical protein